MPVKERQPATDRSDMALSAEPRTVNPARLKYDYSKVDESHRERVQFATVTIQDYLGRAAESIIYAGKELLEVKEVLTHGQFGEWIDVEFGMSHRTANNWMNVAKTYGDKIATVANLNATALILLAAPGTPEAARQEVETKAQATGKPPKRKEVQAVVQKHKPPAPDPAPPAYTPEPERPATPDDLAAAGYVIEGHWSGKYHWKFPNPAGPGAQFGVLYDTPGEAVEEARRDIARGVVHYDTEETQSPPAATDLPDGYRIKQTPRGWEWQREIGASLVGGHNQTRAQAVAAAHQDWEARQARLGARAVYVEPQPEGASEQPTPRRHLIDLDAVVFHALRAAVLAGALGMYVHDRAVRDAIKQAIEEAAHAE